MATFDRAPAPPELAHGPQTSLPEQRASQAVSRRNFLLAAGSLTAAALLPLKAATDWHLADEVLNDLIYPGGASPMVTLGYDQIPIGQLPYAPEAATVYAGLGQRPEIARRMAIKLADGPYKGQRLSYTEYAAQGINVDNLAAEYQDLEATAGGLHLFFNSLGSIIGANAMYARQRLAGHTLPVPRQVDRQNGAPFVRPIKTITYCSSPFDVDDTYQATAVKLIGRHNLSGTLTEKFLAKMVLAIGSEQRFGNFRQLLESASQATFDELPPKMWASQIRLLATTSLRSLSSAFEGAVTPETLVLYLRPRRADGDTVVKVDQASRRIGQFFTRRFGCQFKEVVMEDAGHADIDKACECPEFQDLLSENSGYRI